MKITVYLLEKHGYQTTYTTYKYIYISILHVVYVPN